MKFHFPSFKDYFLSKFDESFNIYCHNLYLYIIPPHVFFKADFLRDMLIEALIDSIENPLVPPSGPQLRSLFEAPPEPHCMALVEALRVSWEYLYTVRDFDLETGERRVEYKINLRVIRGIVQDVRLSEDTKRAEQLIEGEFFISERGLVIKGLRHDGRDIGRRRAAKVVQRLEELGIYGRNGGLRTVGREILKWNSN